ncbi:hypothetical protein LOTGIDRAFT_153760 [Lottia gigantea]|uniref:Uncharacterized protein n=1 Tax=Lottia gigantea TaxID=225164 RepID=V4BQY2_LOTGI|nr:hypothetical protein LOTGIDRAFT_153760 [Lottia gigantea]ESO91324.1 hypothetical protein LOTGIDRAFT_153760 [Lottia gigantea]
MPSLVSSDNVSEIDQNIKFQFNLTNEMVFLNLNSDISIPIESNSDPVYCPPDQPIPRHIPGIPEKLLVKHRLAGNMIPRPLINNFMVDPPISETERICRQLLPKEEKVETTRVEELIPESERKKQDNGSGEDIQRKKQDNGSGEDIPRVFHKPSKLIN